MDQLEEITKKNFFKKVEPSPSKEKEWEELIKLGLIDIIKNIISEYYSSTENND